MSAILVAAVLSTVHLEADVGSAGGDYVLVPFTVPAGTAEIDVAHSHTNDGEILDWGVWSPDGYRGWGGGLVDDAVIDVAQSSRGYLPGAITPGTWTLVVGKALLVNGAGHYIVDVTCSDTPTVPVQPTAAYTPVVLNPARKWYKGDFHVHSIQSGDAAATFDEISSLAGSEQLDFLNISDHNTVAQHALLAAYQQNFPNLLFMRGAEITTYSGHGNAVGLTSYVDHRLGLNGRTVQGILDDVAAQGAIFIINHPMLNIGTACLGCYWNHVADTPWAEVTGMEIITGSYEYGILAFTPQVLKLWDTLLDEGFRITAIGGSDDHTAGLNDSGYGSPIGHPTTNVLADNLSEAAIVDAVKHGRTVVQLRSPSDAFVEMTMTADDGTEAEIGDEVDGVDHIHITAHVTAGDGAVIQLFRDGVKVDQATASGTDYTTAFDRAPTGDLERYRIQLISADSTTPTVITSHIFVKGKVPTAAGCDCRTTGGPGSLAGLALALGLMLVGKRSLRSLRSTR